MYNPKAETRKTNVSALILCLIGLYICLLYVPASYAGMWNGWIYQDPYPTSNHLGSVHFVSARTGWVGGDHGEIFHTEDGGDSWERQESGTDASIKDNAFVNDNVGWAIGGYILHTIDGGRTWNTLTQSPFRCTKIFFINEKAGWAVDESHVAMYRTGDGGKTWQQMQTGVNRLISSVYFTDEKTGWILAGIDVHRTTDGGTSWMKSTLPVGKLPGHRVRPIIMPHSMEVDDEFGFDYTYGDIAFANAKQGWAVVHRWVFHSEDGGKTWVMQFDPGEHSYGIGHIALRNRDKLCVADNEIYCTINSGKTWEKRTDTNQSWCPQVKAISLAGESDGWSVGDTGCILKTNDDGNFWQSPAAGRQLGTLSIQINGQVKWLWKAQSNIIYRTDDGGRSWSEQNVGLRIQSLMFVNESIGWALGIQAEGINQEEPKKVFQVIKHTTDGGKTWLPQLKDAITSNRHWDARLSSFYFSDNDQGWAVGKNGMILYTADGGKNWQQQTSGTKLNLHHVHFADPEKGIVLGDRRVALGEDSEEDQKAKGIILYTEDGGKRWRRVWEKTPTLLSGFFFLDKNNAWVTAEPSLLLHSRDGGKTWRETRIADMAGYDAVPFFIDTNKGVLMLSSLEPNDWQQLMLVTDDGGKTWRGYFGDVVA